MASIPQSEIISDQTFGIFASPATVFSNLNDAQRTHDWAVLPGCPTVEKSVIISRTSGGTVTGQLVTAKAPAQRTVGAVLRTISSLRDDENGIFVLRHQFFTALLPDVEGEVLSVDTAEDHCLNNYSMSYTSDWELRVKPSPTPPPPPIHFSQARTCASVVNSLLSCRPSDGVLWTN